MINIITNPLNSNYKSKFFKKSEKLRNELKLKDTVI